MNTSNQFRDAQLDRALSDAELNEVAAGVSVDQVAAIDMHRQFGRLIDLALGLGSKLK